MEYTTIADYLDLLYHMEYTTIADHLDLLYHIEHTTIVGLQHYFLHCQSLL